MSWDSLLGGTMSHDQHPQPHHPGFQPHQGSGQFPLTPQQAKAQAKAAKAHARALRPFYQKKRFIVPTALAMIVIISVALNDGTPDTNVAEAGADANGTAPSAPATTEQKSEKKQKKEKKPAPLPGIGTPVRSGDFSFTVHAVECGIDTVGDEYFGADAQGQFCLLEVSAENTGSDAVTLMGFDQKLLDAKGREFSNDTEAGIYIEDDSPFLEEINPGNTSTGTLVFDLPEDVEPVQAVLVGGLMDKPVTVDLTQ